MPGNIPLNDRGWRGEVQGPGNHEVVSQTFGCHASLQNTLAISSPVTGKKTLERT